MGVSRPYTKPFNISRTEKSGRDVGGTKLCHFSTPSVVSMYILGVGQTGCFFFFFNYFIGTYLYPNGIQ